VFGFPMPALQPVAEVDALGIREDLHATRASAGMQGQSRGWLIAHLTGTVAAAAFRIASRSWSAGLVESWQSLAVQVQSPAAAPQAAIAG